ncbi:MAG TPA: Mur ligase family protein [Acidimicrobiales bacterium]|nr:Mur ligase family protein [Acidimicrobiales bacterium]
MVLNLGDLSGDPVVVLGLGRDMGPAMRHLVKAKPRHIVVVDASPVTARSRLNEMGLAAIPVLGELRPAPVSTVAVRSPGYPLYDPEVQRRVRDGMVTTTPMDLWLGERGRLPSVALTGTKGKSSTTVLTATALSRLGLAPRALGNISVSPWEAEPATGEHPVLEMSSFVCADLHTGTTVAALTAIAEDHIDWHGSLDRYHRDKARLFHMSPLGGQASWRGVLDDVFLPPAFDGAPMARVPAPGGGVRERNCTIAAAAALAAANPGQSLDGEALDALARDLMDAYPQLPGRFSTVAIAGGVEYIDDALASNPLGLSAALGSVADREAVFIVGGRDRGADLRSVLLRLGDRPAHSSIVCIDDARHLAADLRPHLYAVEVAGSLEDAVRRAGRLVGSGGAVVFSPAMPTPPDQGDWQARSNRFRAAVARMTGTSVEPANPGAS